jgi:hypothetical protein
MRGGDDSNTSSKALANYVNSQERLQKLAVAKRAGATALPPNVPVPKPGEPGWGTTDTCTDESQFVQVADGIDPDAVLLSRHVHCQRMQTLDETIEVDLMRNANDTGWEFYRPGVAGRLIQTFTVGKAVIATFFQAYGEANSLRTPHKLYAKMVDFQPDLSFPPNLAFSAQAIRLTPKLFCESNETYAGGASNATCALSGDVGVSLNMRLGAIGLKSNTISFAATTAWQQPYGAGAASFRIGLRGYEYEINGTSPSNTNNQSFTVASDSSAGQQVNPVLRCDRGFTEAPAAQAGCVFPKAAAVLVYRRSGGGSGVNEVADHIYDAQRVIPPVDSLGRPTQTRLSPGRFDIKPGTRAIREENGGDAYRGLIRDSESIKKNRAAACRGSRSLFEIRPFTGSGQCPTPISTDRNPCSCDEFPFASTNNGAYYDADSTSVRWLRSPDNNLAGTELSAFLGTERLPKISGLGDGDAYWVEIK